MIVVIGMHDGATWTVLMAAVLAADGKTLLAGPGYDFARRTFVRTT